MNPSQTRLIPAFAPGRMPIVLCVLLALAGCKHEEPATPEGSARFVIAVQQALSEADVQRVDVTLDATDIPETTVPLVKEGTVWTGLLGHLRAGTARRFRAFAYDKANRLIYKGEALGVTITANETVQVHILAQQVDAPPDYSNHGPIITSLIVSRSSVEVGGFVDVQATATDPDGDVLTFAWSAPAGSFNTPSSTQARWTAPLTEGTVLLFLSVSDPSGASTSISFPILVQGSGTGDAEVFVSFNSWPRVTSLTGAPTHVHPGTPVAVSALATDPDGAPGSLSYAWTSTCAGTWTHADSASASFTPSELPASATCDNCELSVKVDDGRGGTGTGHLGICVGSPAGAHFPPQLVSTYQSSRNASAGTTVVFQVHATDPEGGPLTFSWEATSGTLSTPSADAGSSTILWTGPSCVDALVSPTVKAHLVGATGLTLEQPFSVNWTGPACPKTLAFATQPSDAFTTISLSPAVQVQLLDSRGRPIPSASGVTVSVRLGSNPGGGVLSGTTSATTSAGTATFSTLSINAAGEGYTLIAESAGLSPVTSQVFTLRPLRVEGSQLDRLLGTGNAMTRRANNLSATPIAALVEQTDGSFQTFSGVGRADGTFTIEGVPAGAFYLRVGTNYFVTSSRSPDLGVDAAGRPDSATPSTGTSLSVDLQGLDTWAIGGDLEIFSPGVGLWSQGMSQRRVLAGKKPAAGDTRWTQTFDYVSVPSARLVSAAQGDVLTFHQLSARPVGGAITGEMATYGAASRIFSTNTLTLADGATTSLTGTMSVLPQDHTLNLDWRFSAFEALASSIHPAATPAYHAFAVAAFPDGTRGVYTNTPDLMTFYPNKGNRDRVFAFTYGTPLPGLFEAAYGDTIFSVPLSVPLAGGGSASPAAIPADVSCAMAVGELATTPLQPRLSPARTPLLMGQNAFGTLTGVGLTPRLDWSAPAVGVPTYYTIRIFELTVDASNRTRQSTAPVGQLYTAGTHVIVPPGLLTSGHFYFAYVVARSSGNPDFQTHPLRSAWPEATSMLVTGVFSP